MTCSYACETKCLMVRFCSRKAPISDSYPILKFETHRWYSAAEASWPRADGAELAPLGTISKTVSVFCNESGKYLVYNSDQHGFHNPSNLWASERVQIAALGDSFVEGVCVPSNKNLVSLIRQKYPSTLNLGMGGNGPLIELAALTEYLTHQRPKIVLWFYFDGNDISDLEDESQSPLLMRYLNDGFSQNLAQRQPSVDIAIRAYMNRNLERAFGAMDNRRLGLLDFLLLRSLRGKLAQRFLGKSGAIPHSDRNLKLLRRVLATAKSRTERWGGVMILIYLPSRPTIAAELAPSTSFRPKARFLAIARELGIRVVDLTPDLAAPPGLNSWYVFPEFGHYNNHGYRLVATNTNLH